MDQIKLKLMISAIFPLKKQNWNCKNLIQTGKSVNDANSNKMMFDCYQTHKFVRISECQVKLEYVLQLR